MKYLVGIIAIFLVSCTERVMERDLEQFQGKWVLERSLYSSDDKRTWSRDRSRDGWQLEIRNDGTFTLNRLTDQISGTYYTTRFQIHLSAQDDSGLVKEQLLWYDASISKRTFTAYEMEKAGAYQLVWERP